MTTSDFIDDQATVNARIAEHEARLGLPKSAPLDDIARANTVLRGLELVATPARPAAPAVPPTAATAAPVTPANPVTGRQRVAKAYGSTQPVTRPNDAPGFASDGKLHGASLLAAYYAKHA